MTVIVAVKDLDRGVTVMGGDSLRSMPGLVLPLPEEASKVYKTGGFVFGHTGAGRIRNITQAVRLRFGSEGPSSEFNLERVLIEELLPVFREQARKFGFITEEKGKVPDINGRVIIAVGDQICVINSDLSVTPIAQDFFAIGSGRDFALGAMEVGLKCKLPIEEVVTEALTSAAKYVPSVGPPFIIEVSESLEDLRNG